ncbi:MAG: ModD protein [Candidatus Cloacimonetes bacterium]|nr:ModD protein [Candidatus Cloacimonadota bacterium]MDY0173401.1 ModD protein [Candidatus Cloacimonadaceae bacterium]
MLYIPDSYIESLINEDLQLMDLTTLALGIENSPGRLTCFPKRACVLAGVDEAVRIFTKLGAKTEASVPEGKFVKAGQVFLTAVGTAGMLHAGWKIAQNVIEYSSGIATRTAEMVKNAQAVKPDIRVAVTRKHFPGTKVLSLKAALAGGAFIHRVGLSDSVLVFEQHRVFTGTKENFIALIPTMARKLPEKKTVVEADSLQDALAFARAGIDVVQCERFDLKELADFVSIAKKISPSLKISAAGGINASNAAEYAATGIDILVTSWVYFGKPEDVKMRITAEA